MASMSTLNLELVLNLNLKHYYQRSLTAKREVIGRVGLTQLAAVTLVFLDAWMRRFERFFCEVVDMLYVSNVVYSSRVPLVGKTSTYGSLC